jgi:hypothetical protein
MWYRNNQNCKTYEQLADRCYQTMSTTNDAAARDTFWALRREASSFDDSTYLAFGCSTAKSDVRSCINQLATKINTGGFAVQDAVRKDSGPVIRAAPAGTVR